MPENLICLEASGITTHIAPGAGGCIARFALVRNGQSIDLMREAPPEVLARASALGMSSFPLFPYSGRIRNGQFEFEGEHVKEKLNFAPSEHAIHGHAWQAPWDVIEESTTGALLSFEYKPSTWWPYPYRASQRFTLTQHGLDVELRLLNTGSRNMPAGFGLHPYFPRTPQAWVRAEAAGVWLADDDVMPTEHAPIPPKWPLADGLKPNATALDNIFTGWRREATIMWPEHNVGLSMTATAPLDFLVVFTPPGEDFFCVEPVSHCADAFNLAHAGVAQTGMEVLAPQAELRARVSFNIISTT